MIELSQIKQAYDRQELPYRKDGRWPTIQSWFVRTIFVILFLLGTSAFAFSVLISFDLVARCRKYFDAECPEFYNLGGKDFLEISIGLFSLLAIALIPYVIERARTKEAQQAEISRLTEALYDRHFYIEVLAVSWEVKSKYMSWRSPEGASEGDDYRDAVAGGMFGYKPDEFESPEEANKARWQNDIRFHDHHSPLEGFRGSGPEDYKRPNEHMVLSIWINFWREVERDIFHDRISEKDAFNRLGQMYSYYHDFHRQLWMVEYILAVNEALRKKVPVSSVKCGELASLEARFVRQADRVDDEIDLGDDWKEAYTVASRILQTQNDRP